MNGLVDALHNALNEAERVLQCEICGEKFKCAVILPCGHTCNAPRTPHKSPQSHTPWSLLTDCSMCIRRSLTYSELCPSCKHSALASELKPVRRLDALADLLHNVRTLVDAVINHCNSDGGAAGGVRGKRKKSGVAEDFIKTTLRGKRSKSSVVEDFDNNDNVDGDDDDLFVDDGDNNDDSAVASPRALRSQRRSSQQSPMRSNSTNNIVVTRTSNPPPPPPPTASDLGLDDGSRKFDCPVCGVAIELQFLNQHLDVCTTTTAVSPRANKSKQKTPSTPPPSSASKPTRLPDGLRTVTDWHSPIGDRNNLPRNPHFKTLSLPALKSRLQALGLSTGGRRDMMEARHREFVLQCHSNADSASPLSMAAIASQVNAIDFSSTETVALTRSSSALDDDDIAAARSTSAPMLTVKKAELPPPPPPPPPQANEPPTLLQRVHKLAANVDFGEWRVAWSNKFQKPFYFNARCGIGVFEKPAEIAVDVYAVAVEEHRAANNGADDANNVNDTNDDNSAD